MAWGKGFASRKRTPYKGVTYDSKKEAEYAMYLDTLVKNKKILSWERQIVFQLIVNGTKVGKYTIDFKVKHNDGSYELIEVKGFATALWKFRHKLFCALYPDLRVTVQK